MAELDNEGYNGAEKLVISLDIGCTHTAVSFTHAYPGSTIDVRMVTKWPGQPEASGDSKVPTIVAYKKGRPVSFGAEARAYAGDEEHEIAKWFKLHLHPDEIEKLGGGPPYHTPANELEIPRLPHGVSLKSVYVDFIHYVYQATRLHFEGNTPNGKNIWSRLISKASIIFATPNGWDTTQHEFLKDVAVDAGLFESEGDAEERIEFVTESEAAVHYVLQRTACGTWLRKGIEFAVMDCGGSTIDSTVYRCKATKPKLELEEVSISECVQAGGVYVDRAAQNMLKTKLADSKYGDDETISDMVDVFEQKTKRLFDGRKESNVIAFGSRKDNDRNFGIMQGKLTLGQHEVADTFSFSIERVVNSCKKLLKSTKVHHLLLVGGFGESPYLLQQLKFSLEPQGVSINSVEQPAKKAAAEGATLWFVQQYVTAHTARYTVIAEVLPRFDPENQDHWSRRDLVSVNSDGQTRLPGGLDMIIRKGTTLAQGDEVVRAQWKSRGQKPTATDTVRTTLYSWTGDPGAQWMLDKRGKLHPQTNRLCKIEASCAYMVPRSCKGSGNVSHWRLDYEIALSFTGTRLRARLKWIDQGGKTQYGPVKIIPAKVPSEKNREAEALRKAFARQSIVSS